MAPRFVGAALTGSQGKGNSMESWQFEASAYGDRSEQERPKRPQIRRWYAPFALIEWGFEWCEYHVKRMALFAVLEYLGKLSVVVAVLTYIWDHTPSKLRERDQRESWAVITSQEGKETGGGRIKALEDLNSDQVPLSGVAAPGAFLGRVQLSQARLEFVNFENANLAEANLRGANIAWARLSGAKIYSAKLDGAILEMADLTGANLVDSDLTGARMREAKLVGADLRHVILKTADLRRAIFQNADLANADLSGANLRGADLSEADLTGAILAGADLTEANLTNAKVEPDQLAVAKGVPIGIDSSPAQ